ncbi:MAG: short-chain dehydrogenase [Sphingobacteriales bacterium]|nr:MAG: short-chain dehydrogenase [Sphingobacteriales bacterium]
MNYLEPYNFYFELPLYTVIEITNEKLNDFQELVSFEGRINGYNPNLKEQTTFSVSIQRHYDKKNVTPTYFDKTTAAYLRCLRTDERFEYFFFTFQKNGKGNYHLCKIGQYPSIADLHISQIKDYNKVLSKEKLKEFTKAIGLAANGVGIGSFVYLRRIFEFLIEEAHSKAKTKDAWDEGIFQRSRMAEKIEILKSELPDFLVEHKELYGILSKGIHELEEQECLLHFIPVRTGIEMILDDKIIEFEKAERRAKASNAIKGISGQISK